MVRERQTSAPGESDSSGELAGFERGAGRQQRPRGQQQFQQIHEQHQGGYPSGGRSGYRGGYQRGGNNGQQFAGGRARPQGQQQFQQSGGNSGQQFAGGRARPQGQQQSQHQGGYQSGGYQSGRRGGHMGGRGGHGRPHGEMTPQPQGYYPGPEFQQRGVTHQQYPRGAPSQPRMLPYQDATPQPRGVRPPFGGPSRQQYPDPLQTSSPHQPPYRSAPGTSSQAPQQHPRGDTKLQPQDGVPPYDGSTGLSPDLLQANSRSQSPYQSASTTSEVLTGNVPQQLSSSQKVVPASSTAMEFPRRPGIGTLGIKCKVTANHFFIQLPDKDLHQYDVTIKPEVTSRALNRAVIKKLENLYKQSHLGGRLPVYDGRKSLYTAGPLPFDLKDFKITLVDEAGSNQGVGDHGGARKREFTVSIKLVARIDLQGQIPDVPQEAVHALNIALSELPATMSVQFGRSFFLESGNKRHLGEGLQSWSGFHQSIRSTQMGISLNMDLSYTAFIEPLPIIEYVGQQLRMDMSFSRPLSDADHVKIKKALRGINIEVTHRGEMRRKHRISGLTPRATRELTFPVDGDGTLKSVVDYFHETYNYDIQYTWLPCLLVGNQQRPVYMPMEVCKIVPGQRYSKKLNKNQIAALLQETSKRPQERKTHINKIKDQLDYAKDEYSQEFGIKISPQMAQVDARILPAPLLKYNDRGRDKDCLPDGGVWNMRNKRLINGGMVNHWICMNFSGSSRARVDDHTARGFCVELARICTFSGLTFQRDPVMPIITANLNQVERELKTTFHNAMTRLQGKELDLLIVILPEKNCPIYGDLKRICDTDLGLVSQCVSAEHVLKDWSKNSQYFINLSLKINVKVGGRNTVLVDALSRRMPIVSDRSTIIFGADVTHPQPGNDSSPSIAAVVASQDWPEITKFASLASTQTHRQEIIEDLFTSYEDPKRGTVPGGMIRDLLSSFRSSNAGRLPERILFYRDGVSEGQFYQVLLFEVDAIRRACASFSPDYQPSITFVVVQKRHHTRLFPIDPKFTDKSGNILAGTVVDEVICHPTQFNFYLCSHAGLKGTSRPALYHVLWDENNFSADDLQTLTYNLCYTYARCTRSVSIVPAAYYAHLAASRARCYIDAESSDSGSVEGGSSNGGASRRASAGANVNVKPLPVLKENVRRGMFFC